MTFMIPGPQNKTHSVQSNLTSTPSWTSLNNSKADTVMRIEGDGDLVFEAPGVRLSKETENLEQRIQRLEHLLGVTGRNPILEEQYPELKDVGEHMDQEVDRIWRESANQVSDITAQYQVLVKECELMNKLKENND